MTGVCLLPNQLNFFSALKFLDKDAWLLTYKNGGHILFSDADKKDYTEKVIEFFDHYLKNKSAPKWMTGPATVK